MEKLKIVGWTNFECKYPTKNCYDEKFREIMQLIGEEVVKHGYSFSGQDHQNEPTGVPVFSDGTCLRASMRAWGYIMAAIYSAIEDTEVTYMDYYMDCYKEKLMPEYHEIDVEIGHVEDERPGMIVEEDVQLVSQSVAMGMKLMTLDKVLNKYAEILKQYNK